MSKKKLRTCVPEEMENPIENLCPLITDKYSLRTSYAKRNNQYIYQSIHPADLQSFEQDGWMIHKEGTQKVRIKKFKTHDVLLEDQAWCLFYRMGYPELNDKGCKIKYKWSDGRNGEKQVDIFAKDEETVIIAECKSRET